MPIDDSTLKVAAQLALSALVDDRLSRDDQRVLCHSLNFFEPETGRLSDEAAKHRVCGKWTGMHFDRVRKARKRLVKHGYLEQESLPGRTSVYFLGGVREPTGILHPGVNRTMVQIDPGSNRTMVQNDPGSNYTMVQNDPGSKSTRVDKPENGADTGPPGFGDEGRDDGTRKLHSSKRPPSSIGITTNLSDRDQIRSTTLGNTQDRGFDWWSVAKLVTEVSGVHFAGHGKLFADEDAGLFEQLKLLPIDAWRGFAEALRDMPKPKRKRLLYGRTDFLMKFIVKTSSLDSVGDRGGPDVWALRAPLEEKLADLEGREPTEDVLAGIVETKRRLGEIGT